MTKIQHKRTAVASTFRNGISWNTKCAERDGFHKVGRILFTNNLWLIVPYKIAAKLKICVFVCILLIGIKCYRMSSHLLSMYNWVSCTEPCDMRSTMKSVFLLDWLVDCFCLSANQYYNQMGLNGPLSVIRMCSMPFKC